MKITLTTTEGLKEYEDMCTLDEINAIDGKVYLMTPCVPQYPVIEVDATKVLLIHITKE